MSDGVLLGPFELRGQLAAGGMGQVWTAVHRAQGVPVALKVLTAAAARSPERVAAFRNEVRAVASLAHPAIVTVFDYGEVSEDVEEASGGVLPAGSPFLAMELVEGGSLGRCLGSLPWPDLCRVLVIVLDALAHAHARGVVHRDLKPGNILLGADGSTVKLTDFGIAHALDRGPLLHEAVEGYRAGTPRYMAPEQIRGTWRDCGPWTDLYMLGCVAYALVTGRPPFGGPGWAMRDLLQAHLEDPVPAMKPRMPVPHGFEEWVRRLLEKDPARRYLRSADAAWGLVRLGEPEPVAGAAFEPYDGAEDPTGLCELTELDRPAGAQRPSTLPFAGLPGGGSSEAAGGGAPRSAGAAGSPSLPPLPPAWASSAVRAEAREHGRLVGVGLGLYGVRPIPIVDRERERDALWDALREVCAAKSARAVLLRGPSGCGKSRLAQWLCERAHELGAATFLKAVHGPIQGPADGIRAMVARHLQCTGLPRAEVFQRITKRLTQDLVTDPYEALALTEFLAPASREEPESGVRGDPARRLRLRFGSSDERYGVACRLVEGLSRERAVVVWLDDVQWGFDALAFALRLLRAQAVSPRPVLLVMTVRDDALAEREDEARRLEEVLARPEASTLEVPVLPPEHRKELVRGLLGLEGELADRVEERTAGNPLFAVQLVGDWVARGLLEPGDRGFRLRPGATPTLPANIDAVWTERIVRLLEGRPPSDAVALELAAVLGQDVDCGEWRQACGRAGVPAPDDLVDALLTERLAQAGEHGADSSWSFVHAMLRESVENRARAAGRWVADHRACAGVLAEKARDGGRGAAERVAGHLLAAGDRAAALEPLLDAANERATAGDYHAAEALLRTREAAMCALRLPDCDVRWGQNALLAARAACETGGHGHAGELLDRLEASSAEHGWSRTAAEARTERSMLARLAGRLESAVALAREAETLAAALGDAALVARARMAAGNALRNLGSIDEAARCYEAAAEAFAAAGDACGSAWCNLGLALVERQRGRFDDSAARAEIAREGFASCGSRRGVALCANVIGECARYRGDLEEAAAWYGEALIHLRAVMAVERVVPETNLALVLIARERYAEAMDVLDSAATAYVDGANRLYLGTYSTYLLPCLAAAADWERWDREIERAAAWLIESGMVDVDLSFVARKAGDLALAAGQPARARRAYAVAAQQLRGLGRTDAAEEVERVLVTLPGPA